MTRRVLGVVVLGAAVMLLCDQEAAAFGKRSRGCETPCATTSGCTTPCSVTYVDKVVTSYKTEWKTKKVEVEVIEYKMEEEKFKYKVAVPVTTKSKVKVCEFKQVNEPYKYTVMAPIEVKEKVKVCEHVWTTKDEPYSWYECVPVHAKQKRTICETICVPTVVTHVVPMPSCATPTCGKKIGLFGRLCHKSAHTCDTPCPTPCPTPCETQTVCTTVMKPTVVTKEIEVDVVTYSQIKKDGVRKVQVCTPVWTEKEVTVWKCVPVQKDGVRVVCVPTWVEKEVDVCSTAWVEKDGARVVCVPTWVEKEVDVCSTAWVEKDGVRHVCKPFKVKKWVDHSWCETVKFETTVKVPVMVPCATPVPTCCN